MKRLWTFIATSIFFWVLFAAIGRETIPRRSDLSYLTGSVTSIQEVAGRQRLRSGNILITLNAAGVKRELVSYDRVLLDQIRPGQVVTAGLYSGRGDSEIWSIQAADNFERTYSDTYEIRASRISKNRVILIAFALVAGFLVVYRHLLRPRRNDA
jgi:hypothetical protein